MINGKTVLLGLMVFLGLVSAPFWTGVVFSEKGPRPTLEMPVGETACVEDTEYMRHWHMDLLNRWRDEVVRKGKRMYVAKDGAKHEMSLTHSCLGCHKSRAGFCDKCHHYVGVDPYCWDCHLEKKGE
jgi:hypothetical protein